MRRAAILVPLLPLLVLLAVPGPTPAAAADSDPPSAAAVATERGVALYDAGDYEGARQIFEELDARGEATGPVLYRLAYCLRVTGAGVRAREVETRALEALVREYEEQPGLEVAFYLSNALRNQGRRGDSRNAAKRETDRLESGAVPDPQTGLDLFRVGKLYADQAREEQAIAWYRKALEKFAENPAEHASYSAWARRYLGEVFFARADFEGAVREYSALAEEGGATRNDMDRLATTLARMGRYGEAADAWRETELLDRGDGNRARYCWRLARMAEALESLPSTSPDGRNIRGMAQAELEAVMKEQADTVKQAKERAAAGEPPADLQKEIDAAKPVFVAAAMEYAIRNHPIRETAFMNGYAPLIFHESQWVIPE